MDNIEELFRVYLKKYSSRMDKLDELKKFLEFGIKDEVSPFISQENDSQTTEFSRHSAKNFVFEYPPEVDTTKISEILHKKFCGGSIKNNRNSFMISLESKKNVTSVKSFIVENRVPKIRRFTKEEFDYLNMSKIRNNFKNNEEIAKFFENLSDDTCKSLAEWLANKLSSIKILIYSEYIISAILFPSIVDFGESIQWKDLKLISIDSKMEDLISLAQNKIKIKNFRCDLILIFKSTLFIIEYKYRYDRKNTQVKNALECIKKKNYSSKVLKYLRSNKEELFHEISNIALIGIGFSRKEIIRCEIEFLINPI